MSVDMRQPVGNVPIVMGSRMSRARGPQAPHEPEWRASGIAPAPALTAEEVAQQLAEDPEFRDLVGETWLADVSVLTARAHR